MSREEIDEALKLRERELVAQIEKMQAEYREAVKPLVDELIYIRSIRIPTTPALALLLAESTAKYAAMLPEERAAHDKAQRESWARGMLPTGDPRLD